MDSMKIKLEEVKSHFDEVSQLIIQPDIMSDMAKYSKLSKEYKELEKIIVTYDKLKQCEKEISGAKDILNNESDAEYKELAKEELKDLKIQLDNLTQEIKTYLVPQDPNDEKNIILEIRSGTGGDEASIFVGDLFRMYQRYCEKQKWKVTISDLAEGTSGGYNKIVANVTGDKVYGRLKFESGVHRVQRIPQTETQGRIHTSAASVAILPEVEDVEVEINMNEVRKDLYCSSGPGGQSVNTTYSAVRLTHEPTGIVVQCQDQKSQLKNFDKALKELRARIYAIELANHNEQIASQRRSMVGSGDRSDKIRTYNYPQSRVTDHRIGLSVHNLNNVMDGDIDEFIEQLHIVENANKMIENAD